MATRTLTKIALMACILFVSFTALSSVLYLEAITLMIVLFAMVFPLQESLLAALVFGMLNMFVQGITIFSMMYVLIYPLYTLLVYWMRPVLLNNRWALISLTATMSFATGILLDLPFILLSARVTLVYILMGVKTSLIQGSLTAVLTLFIYDPLCDVLLRIERKK